MPDDTGLREAVLTLLRGGRAHVTFVPHPVPWTA
jgi:hypothetical protein